MSSKQFHTVSGSTAVAGEAELRSIVENLTDAYFRTSLDGQILLASRSAEQISGYRLEEVIGRNITDFYLDPAEREHFLQTLADHDGRTQGYETGMRRKDGSELWISISANFVYDERGEVSGVEGTVRDITERRRMETALRESEQRYKALFDNATDCIFLVRDGRFIDCNPMTLEMFGGSREAIIGSDPARLSPQYQPDGSPSADRARELITAALNGSHQHFEWQHMRLDGSLFDAEVDLNRVDIEGQPHLFGMVRDVTGRRRIETALRESEKRYKALFDSAGDAIFLMQDDRFIDCNPMTLEMFGCTRDQIIGQPPYHYSPEYQPDGRASRDKALEKINAAFEGTPQNFDWTHIKHDGTPFDAEVTLNRVDLGGTPHLLASARDVSERKRIERALQISRRNLAEAQRIAHVGSWDCDIATQAMHWSDEMFRIHGLEPCSRTPSYELLAERVLPEDWPGVQDAIDAAVRGEAGMDSEFRIQRPSGEVRFVHARGEILRDHQGMPEQLVGTMQDVTEHIQSLAALRSSEERFRDLAENINEVFWLVSTDWNRTYYISPAYEKVWRESTDTLYADPWSWMYKIHADDRKAIEAFMGNVSVDQDEILFPEFRLVHQDGDIRWISGRAYPVRDQDGNPVRIAGISEDITDRHQAEEQLRQSAVAFDNTAEGILILDSARRIQAANRAFTELTGYTEDEIRQQTTDRLQPELENAPDNGVDWATVERDRRWQGETLLRRANGELFPAWLTVSMVLDNGNRPVNYVYIFSDITTIKRSQEKLDYLAHHDPLTDLPNRLLLNARLEHALQHARRERHRVGVLFIDLDRFKNVNDSLGHSMGDEILIESARRLRELLRDEDTIARLGGDEFIVILDQVHHSQDVITLGSRIMEQFRQPFVFGMHTLHVTASIGISVYPEDGRDIDTLIKNADAAMYRAKEHGRDNFQFYTQELTNTAFERILLETSLRRALDEEDLVLYYQPQISLDDGRIIGAEALIRWNHPDMGLIAPNRFIPLAEESGLIIPIGNWVLRTACEQARYWQDIGLPVERIAVNISAVQVLRSNMLEEIKRALNYSGLDPSCLELEITESVLMHEGGRTLESLESLRTLGVELAIDDFGTGYSSLSYLKRLPIDRLKIDRSFVNDATTDANDEAIIRAVIAMGHSLQLKIMAEGVETQEQAEFLRQLGCDAAQGYYYGRPVPAEEFARLFSPASDDGPGRG